MSGLGPWPWGMHGAKLEMGDWSVGNCAHEIQTYFLFRSCCRLSRHSIREWQSFHLFARFFVDAPRCSRYIVYLRHATIFVLADASADSMWRLQWRPSEGDRCSGTWYGLLMNNRHWELVLNHSRAMLLASCSLFFQHGLYLVH
jgi:hypothetical protein